MNLYKINWKIHLNSEYTKDITEFATKLVKDKRHYFLYLKLEIKYDYLEIKGYSLHSLSEIKDDSSVLLIYLYDSLDIFIQIVFCRSKIENNSKIFFYINNFGKIIFTLP